MALNPGFRGGVGCCPRPASAGDGDRGRRRSLRGSRQARTAGVPGAPPKSRVAYVLAAVLVLMAACAGSRDPVPAGDARAEQAALEGFFLEFRRAVQAGDARMVLEGLSPRTLDWLDDMRFAARRERRDDLRLRPFFEVLTIVALRVEQRKEPAFLPTPLAMVEKVLLRSSPVRKSLLKGGLGDFHVRGRTAQLGFKKAENVPVFHFVKERGGWKIDLYRTLPLILQGAESLARRRSSDTVEQAVYLLERFGGIHVLPEDLR